jgi:hypothetical protein
LGRSSKAVPGGMLPMGSSTRKIMTAAESKDTAYLEMDRIW